MDLIPGRRAFLKALTTATTAPVVARLLSLEEAFAQELATLHPSVGGLASPQDMRGRYLLDPRVSYLNHASIGTVPEAVHAAGMRYREICEENPWLYIWGGAWEESRESVRRQSADLLGCDPAEVAMTHNTTEGIRRPPVRFPPGRCHGHDRRRCRGHPPGTDPGRNPGPGLSTHRQHCGHPASHP